MHNIRTNFRKFYSICKELFGKEVNSLNNFQRYPVKPKMNDLQIIALSCCMEALGIDSENLLWSKLKTVATKAGTNVIGRFLGRLVPWIGTALTAKDIWDYRKEIGEFISDVHKENEMHKDDLMWHVH